MLDSGCWILDSGYLILDTGYWMLDAGYWILQPVPFFANCQLPTANCRWILDTGYLILDFATNDFILPTAYCLLLLDA
jgi:hypothetical protein